MISMSVARVERSEKLLCTMVVLVDESRQWVLLLWFKTERDFSSQMRMFSSTQQKAAALESSFAEFIMSILQALHGTLAAIEIDTLEADILYARVKLQSSDGKQQSIKARLENALPLAVESHCRVSVAEEVLEHQGLKLEAFGKAFEEQLDAVVFRGQQAFRLGTSQALSPGKAPRNMDFTDDFRGWSFMSYPETQKLSDYQIDSTVTYKNKASLAISLRAKERSADETFFDGSALLMHEGFTADDYQGKRLRMVAYARSENVKQGIFGLHINGPARAEEEEHKAMYMTSNQHEPIEGTRDWSRYELVIDVPEDAATINCSFNLMGSGKVWLDGFQFEIVDASVPLTGTRILPPPRQPVNLAFERSFDGWIIAGGNPQDYTRSVEADASGRYVVSFKHAIEQPRGDIVLQQIVNAYAYRGQTVRLAATIRAEGITEQASLYLTYGLGNKTRIERTIQGKSEWQAYAMNLLIPDEPGRIEFGLMLYGPGQIWLRAMQFAALQGIA